MNVLTNTATAEYTVDDQLFTVSSSVAFEKRGNCMPCKHYNSVCGCGGCKFFKRTTAITVVNNILQLTIPTETVTNHEIFCVCLAQAIPATVTPNTKVTVMVGNKPFVVLNSCGNFLYADQIRSRSVLHFVAAPDSQIFMLNGCNKLCPTAHVFEVG